MDFFGDINKVIETAGNTAKQKTKDLTDLAKMNAAIKSEEKTLQELYGKIGELYVKKYDSEPERLLQNLVEQVKETEGNIELYTVKIQEIKKVGKCPNCGNEVPEDAVFCMRCGTRLISEQRSKKVEEERKCTKCGHQLENGVKFCTYCGSAVDELEEAEDRFIEEVETNGENYNLYTSEENINEEITEIKEDTCKNEEKRRFCVHCGNELEEDNRFCTKCGTAVEEK